MKEILNFDYDEERRVRVVRDRLGEPWWVAKDVCAILGHTNASMAVEGLDEDEKLISTFLISGQDRGMVTVSESGLYTLIIRSNKPEARPFRRWITHEVLPAIRRQGFYSVPGGDQAEASGMTTRGPVTITVAMLREAADAIKAAMIIARAIGYRNGQARVVANELVREITGIDVFELMNVPAENRENGTLLPLASEQPAPDGLDEESFAAFVRERCSLGPHAKVSASRLFEAFLEWLNGRAENLAALPTRQRFGRVVSRHFRHMVSAGGAKTFVGIGLGDEAGPETAAALIRRFIEERCVENGKTTVDSSELYGAFAAWRASRGDETPMSHTLFGTEMGRIFRKKKVKGRVVYEGLTTCPPRAD